MAARKGARVKPRENHRDPLQRQSDSFPPTLPATTWEIPMQPVGTHRTLADVRGARSVHVQVAPCRLFHCEATHPLSEATIWGTLFCHLHH